MKCIVLTPREGVRISASFEGPVTPETLGALYAVAEAAADYMDQQEAAGESRDDAVD